MLPNGHSKYNNASYQGNNVNSPIFTRNAQTRCCLLKFLQDIPPVVYTGENIVVKDTTIDIALFDDATGELVKFGPDAYAKVEIVLLNGDFDPNRYWTADQFNIHQIVGPSSMLGKDIYLNLQQGVGSVGEIKFKHGAQWMKKNKFRLGARMVDPPATIEVREAVTGLFLVKDKRLKSKKRDPPSPSDEVWRLKGIGRDGRFHKKLFAKDIRTVGDFLTEFSKDGATLKDILGPTMSDHLWNVTLTHAQRCKWDDTQFLNCPLETCQEIAMVNCPDSFTDMSKNQHEPRIPPVSLDYGASQELSFQKPMEYVTNSDDAIIFDDPEQVPYGHNQKSTPTNQLLLTCLKDEDIPEWIKELQLLDEEPGKSFIMLSDEHNDQDINSSSPEVKKLSMDSKNWQQCVIPDATVFKGYDIGKKKWTLLSNILKWFLISRIVKIENRIAKRLRSS